MDPDGNVDVEKSRRERDARGQALTLELMGDLPFAEVKPPENILFVCKLNPVTQDSDLELIFSRFGKILSCEVIRDHKTGDSLQYAFIEFEEKSACEAAYFKMQDVLIDDRRIHVDFSQSVSKLSNVWRNETNTRRRKQARAKGGWGGIQKLEKWRKYRNEEEEDEPSYKMVHGDDELRGKFEKTITLNKNGPRDATPPERSSSVDRREDGGWKGNRNARGTDRALGSGRETGPAVPIGERIRDHSRNHGEDRYRDSRWERNRYRDRVVGEDSNRGVKRRRNGSTSRYDTGSSRWGDGHRSRPTQDKAARERSRSPRRGRDMDR